jgi:BirA family transcriptional regulator, biotin operon repressor / biotin---[acetyl-CoA-carboxylase] ligase
LNKKNTLFVGKVFLEFDSLPSTNLCALELLAKSKPVEGLAISAAYQSAGKGQIGSRWESPPGLNLTLSVLFYPVFLPPRQQFALNQAVALSVRDLVASYGQKPVFVKWPNDIYVNHRKIAGILIQNTLSGSTLQSSVVGVGLNVNQEIFSPELPNPTSLRLETGQSHLLPALRQAFFSLLEQRYLQLKSGRFAELDEAYRACLYGYQQRFLFERPTGGQFEGKILGVGRQGHLRVGHRGGEEAFQFKQIKMLRPVGEPGTEQPPTIL